jgi:small subunit ribosomal protein S4
MGRYTGPKGRINRRLGVQIYENSGAVRAFEKRDYPPGQHIRKKKLSNYGAANADKQKIKHYYGMREKQLRRFNDMATRMPGNTGENLLILCERRLDNVIRRAGFSKTRLQGRQAIVHRHFQLNGRTVDIPSIIVKPGDVITLRERPNLINVYKDQISTVQGEKCEWLNTDATEFKIIVTSLPTFADVTLQVEINQVVAFMAR